VPKIIKLELGSTKLFNTVQFFDSQCRLNPNDMMALVIWYSYNFRGREPVFELNECRDVLNYKTVATCVRAQCSDN